MSISCLFSFPKEKKTVNAKFDSSVKRLLCLQRKQLVVYDLPTLQHPIVNRNVIPTAPNFSAKIGTDPFGFAGLNDDLVISASDNNGLMIWASPDGRHQQDQTVDQPIQVLQGHNHFIRNVRYSNEASAIVSCDADGIIKLWTPGVPLHKTSTWSQSCKLVVQWVMISHILISFLLFCNNLNCTAIHLYTFSIYNYTIQFLISRE